MKRREITFLVTGLIIGIMLGILMQEAGLFGTAGTKTKAVNYYQVPLDSVDDWLVTTYPDASENVQAMMDAFVDLSTTAEVAANENTTFLLTQAMAALYGEEDAADMKLDESGETSLCLARDDDPSAGSTYYLYLTAPAQVTKGMTFPKEWEQLNKPRGNELYWQLLACLPTLE